MIQASSSKEALDNMRAHASSVGEDVRDLAGAAKQKVQDTMEHVKDSAAETYERGKEKVADVQKGLQTLIRDQPVTALLVAAGVGLLVGILWKRS